MAMPMTFYRLSFSLTLLLLPSVMFLGSTTTADKAKDRQECAEQLAGLATCLPFVQGQAKAPTPDCCGGLKQILKINKKCLCVIIRDRNDPDLGLQINVTLALSLPSLCNAPADVTKCPALLHMDPHSPEAQVFYQLAKASHQSPAPSPTAVAPTPTGNSEGPNSARTTSFQPKNEGSHNIKNGLGFEIFAHLVAFWYIIGI